MGLQDANHFRRFSSQRELHCCVSGPGQNADASHMVAVVRVGPCACEGIAVLGQPSAVQAPREDVPGRQWQPYLR